MSSKGADKPDLREKQVLGCNWSTWFKLINLVVGVLMCAYAFFSLFEIGGGETSLIMIYIFKIYEM